MVAWRSVDLHEWNAIMRKFYTYLLISTQLRPVGHHVSDAVREATAM